MGRHRRSVAHCAPPHHGVPQAHGRIARPSCNQAVARQVRYAPHVCCVPLENAGAAIGDAATGLYIGKRGSSRDWRHHQQLPVRRHSQPRHRLSKREQCRPCRRRRRSRGLRTATLRHRLHPLRGPPRCARNCTSDTEKKQVFLQRSSNHLQYTALPLHTNLQAPASQRAVSRPRDDDAARQDSHTAQPLRVAFEGGLAGARLSAAQEARYTPSE